jgi:DNA-binding SARP family transcriptional activator
MVDALAFWRGPVGDGLGHGLLATPMFVALHGKFFEACIAAAELAVPQGQPKRILPAVRLTASSAPLNEGVHAALATGLAATGLAAAGLRAEALAAFREIRTRLMDELGIDPGPALQAAQQHVLAHNPKVSRRARSPVSPKGSPPYCPT